VDGVAAKLYAAEIHARVVAQSVIVIAGDKYNARAFTRLPQELLQNVVMALWPVRSTANLPEIDDVADEIERLALDVFQEIEKRGCLRIAHSEVDIGKKHGAVV
jgi:hypothetical protein